MRQNLIVSVVVLTVILLVVGGTGCTKLRARDHLNKGVQAYRAGQYAEAVEHFKVSVELDSEFPTARLYLATAYMSQYVPGSESAENLRVAKEAYDEFLRVLEQAPGDPVALASIATLHFHQNKFDDAEEWFRKLIAVAPRNKEAYYTLGVIAWTRSFQRRMGARAELGMTPETPGPLSNQKMREEVREANLPIIEAGLGYLSQALNVDPEYDDAMAYLNLLYRERADLADTTEEYARDIEMADDWVDKTLETKKLRAARAQIASFGLTEVVEEEEEEQQ